MPTPTRTNPLWIALVACAMAACAPQPAPSVAQPEAPAGSAAAAEAAEPPASEAEQQLLALINRERATAGVPALTWNGRLGAAARARSIALGQTSTAQAPLAPETDDRVRHLDVATTVFVENVARSPAPADAHRAWMANPRQRANILSPAVNEVGIGVVPAAGGQAIFATEIFIRRGPKIDPRAVAASLRDALVAPNVKSNTELAEIAQQYAEGLAAGRTDAQVWPGVRSRITSIEHEYVRFRHTVTAVADIADVDPHALLHGQVDDFGVGVAQGTHPDLGENAVWIVVMIGEEVRGHTQ